MAAQTKKRSSLIHSGLIAQNKRARYDYEISEELEVGLVLTGTEVKSLREGRAQIAEAYIGDKDDQLYMFNSMIATYRQGNRFNHEEKRPRKCLAHRKQVNKWLEAIKQKGMTIVPIKLYFNDRGVAKLMIGLGKGKRDYEKRDTIKKRDWERQKSDLLRN